MNVSFSVPNQIYEDKDKDLLISPTSKHKKNALRSISINYPSKNVQINKNNFKKSQQNVLEEDDVVNYQLKVPKLIISDTIPSINNKMKEVKVKKKVHVATQEIMSSDSDEADEISNHDDSLSSPLENIQHQHLRWERFFC